MTSRHRLRLEEELGVEALFVVPHHRGRRLVAERRVQLHGDDRLVRREVVRVGARSEERLAVRRLLLRHHSMA
jgi:hypothetical protein